MKAKVTLFDRDYLWRCKQSSPEVKLQWLAGALEFARTRACAHNAFTDGRDIFCSVQGTTTKVYDQYIEEE